MSSSDISDNSRFCKVNAGCSCGAWGKDGEEPVFPSLGGFREIEMALGHARHFTLMGLLGFHEALLLMRLEHAGEDPLSAQSLSGIATIFARCFEQVLTGNIPYMLTQIVENPCQPFRVVARFIGHSVHPLSFSRLAGCGASLSEFFL